MLQILQQLLANQVKMLVAMKTDQAKAIQEDFLARLEARIETSRETDREERKADQENLKGMMEEMNMKVDGKLGEMPAM
jgi:uncharacterized FlaG/YvyC family protein